MGCCCSAKASAIAEKYDLKGRVWFITGGNSGIGKMTAILAARRGATVYIGCRDVTRGREAERDIKREAASDAVHFIQMDLNSLASIRRCAAEFIALNTPLHVLVNNAGIMALPNYEVTADGFEKQFGVNHLGHFLLTVLLLPALVRASPSRVVNVGSVAHKWFTPASFKAATDLPPKQEGYSKTTAYGISKSCNILFTKALATRMARQGVSVYSLHPGVIPTSLGRYDAMSNSSYIMCGCCMKSIDQGAATTMHCAIVAPESQSGMHFAACAPSSAISKAITPENETGLWDLSVRLTGCEDAVAAISTQSFGGRK